MADKIEETKQPDIIDLIIQAETEWFETDEQELIFFKAVVEAGITSALPGRMGETARVVYAHNKLAERNWAA